MSDQQVPSFIAEAEWKTSDANERPGLEGTAILYGEKVSLFYYLIRKPWILARHLLGLSAKGK